MIKTLSVFISLNPVISPDAQVMCSEIDFDPWELFDEEYDESADWEDLETDKKMAIVGMINMSDGHNPAVDYSEMRVCVLTTDSQSSVLSQSTQQ